MCADPLRSASLEDTSINAIRLTVDVLMLDIET